MSKTQETIFNLEAECRDTQDQGQLLADELTHALRLEQCAFMDAVDAGYNRGSAPYDAALQNIDRFTLALTRWYSFHGVNWSMDAMGNQTKEPKP